MPTQQYRIQFAAKVERLLEQLDKRDRQTHDRLLRAIKALAYDPHPRGGKKLQGRYDDIYRVRVGSWRILYHVRDDVLVIVVVNVVQRKDAYR
jgi:mRNA interferase RelE/StbE